jgi:hypothetical protein
MVNYLLKLVQFASALEFLLLRFPGKLHPSTPFRSLKEPISVERLHPFFDCRYLGMDFNFRQIGPLRWLTATEESRKGEIS